jgi:hypothetical protein
MSDSVFDDGDLIYNEQREMLGTPGTGGSSNAAFTERYLFEQQIREEMRKEFIDVYSKNELYYQNFVKQLSETIKEKDQTIRILVELLNKKDKNDLK